MLLISFWHKFLCSQYKLALFKYHTFNIICTLVNMIILLTHYYKVHSILNTRVLQCVCLNTKVFDGIPTTALFWQKSKEVTNPPRISLLSWEKHNENIQKLLYVAGIRGRASCSSCSPYILHICTVRWIAKTKYYIFIQEILHII